MDPKEVARAALRFPMSRASRSLSVYDHFATMVFEQLTHRLSLRDVEACMQSRSAWAYQMGIRGNVTRTNLAYANEHRDWRVLMVESRPVDETVGLRCDQTIRLNSRQGRKDYPEVLRRISYVDPESGQALVFLTSEFDLAA